MKIGFSYRPAIHSKNLNELLPLVDYVEIMPDIMSSNEIYLIQDKLSGKEVGLHSLKTSLGSPEGIQQENDELYYLMGKFLKAKYYSDHVALSYIDNHYLTTVRPIAYDERNIRILSENLKSIMPHYQGNQYLIENITNHGMLDGSSLTEGEFFKQVLQKNSSVKMLLDLTNAYISAINVGISPREYLKQFPLEKVKTIHVSGYEYINNKIQDTHAVSINKTILQLLQFVLQRSSPEFVMLERNFNHDNADLVAELRLFCQCIK